MLKDTSSWESKHTGESGTADFGPAVLPGGGGSAVFTTLPEGPGSATQDQKVFE